MRPLRIDINLLLQRCEKGDRKAQMQLHRQFYSMGLNLCLRYARNREEAREMLNDGFLKIFRHLEKEKFEGAFVPWFKKVLVHSTIDHHRKYKKYQPFEELDKIPPSQNEYEIQFNFEYEELLLAVQKLSPQYRMVFNLYVIEGYKHPEIAEMLNISVGTSKSNLSKAKVNLQSMIKKEFRHTKKSS